MKFEHNGLRFEVSDLDHIVITTVRRLIQPAQGGKPAKVTKEYTNVDDKGTRVWYRLKFAKGIRWAKFRIHGEIPEVPETLADSEQWETPEGIQKMIIDAMHRPDIRLWFSGTYVNIRITENWQEVQKIKAQEERRKRKARQPKHLTPSQVNAVLMKAISSAGAQVRQESVSTPFGLIPVMTVSHRRKHDRM